jgi:hypothetical protein
MSGTTFQAIHVWIAERKTLLFWNLTMCEARKEKLLAIWPVRGTQSQLFKKRLISVSSDVPIVTEGKHTRKEVGSGDRFSPLQLTTADQNCHEKKHLS